MMCEEKYLFTDVGCSAVCMCLICTTSALTLMLCHLKNGKNLKKLRQGKRKNWYRISKGSNINTVAYKFQEPVTEGSSLAKHNTEKHINPFLNSKVLKHFSVT